MTAATGRRKGFIILGILLIAFALGTIAFWVVFFTSGAVSISERPAYIEHERSFPLADLYMVISAITAAIGLFLRRRWAVLFGIMAGSATIFLGLMDTLYAIQHGMIRDLSPASIQTAYICAVCLIFGPATIVYLWRNRYALDRRSCDEPENVDRETSDIPPVSTRLHQ